MKVFDCQGMPSDVRRSFFNATAGTANDCLVDWTVGDCEDPDEDIRAVDAWLVANGAVDLEGVVVSHWW